MRFSTKSLVEAALMRLRTSINPECHWDKRRQCTFHFLGVTEEDIAFATSDATVKAREFNFHLVEIKTAMYSSKDD